MTMLLFALLMLAAEPFPELNEPFVEDVDSSLTAEPIAGPDDEPTPTRRNVKPRTPPSPAPPPPMQEIKGVTVRSPSVAPQTAPQAAPQQPASMNAQTVRSYPPITGWGDASWGDPHARVEARYGDRPLLERGENRYMIQDQCESHSATVIYQFSFEGLQNVVCLFREGMQAEKPDYALYQDLRAKLVARFGSPVATNESAPDDTQAAVWRHAPGELTLSFEPRTRSLQLRAEKSAR